MSTGRGTGGSPSLEVKVGAVTLANPVLLASGTCGYGLELAPFLDLGAVAGVCTKGLSLRPRPGNPAVRICETAGGGMLNAIGLANVGLEAFVRDKLPPLRAHARAVIANFFGETVEEYAAMARGLDGADVDALELNISCPNIEHGSAEFGTDARAAAKVVAAVRAATRKPLWVKLSPNAGDRLVEVARAVVEAGADALTLVNTITGMAIDARRRRPVLANRTGGLSGAPIKPIALAMVDRVHRARLGVPLVGIGGIQSGVDVAEFLLAGASAVQLGTRSFVEPGSGARVVAELATFLREEGIARASDLVGALA